jgi:hypothetical protein
LIEQEQNFEAERDAQLSAVSDKADRKRLEKIIGIERGRASERISQMSE